MHDQLHENITSLRNETQVSGTAELVLDSMRIKSDLSSVKSPDDTSARLEARRSHNALISMFSSPQHSERRAVLDRNVILNQNSSHDLVPSMKPEQSAESLYRPSTKLLEKLVTEIERL